MTPTPKQKRAFKNIVENSSTQKKALLDAGYSEATAIKPTQVTKSKGWRELLEQYMPDKDLAAKHKELLDKQEVIVRNNVSTKEIEVIPTGQIDPNSVKSALDMAYKMKGYYKEDNEQKVAIIQMVNYGEDNNASVSVSTEDIPSTTT